MSETSQFGLPLIAAAQAQKHVTVNDALSRLDALAQLRLVSVTQTVPPVAPLDGNAYGVPTGAVNAWDGHIGEIAIFSNGGWVFVAPRAGWRAWIADAEAEAVFFAGTWQTGLVAASAGGATTRHEVIEFTHVIAAGSIDFTSVDMAAGALVYGVSGRVVADITGAGVTGWQLGVDGAEARYGQNLPLGSGGGFVGMSGRPYAYDAATALRLEATGGDFVGGTVKLVIHLLRMSAPDAV